LVAKDPSGKKNINLAATGMGISQIVPVVVQSLLTPKNGCLIVEQPEVHLHPAAQTTLADLFLEQAQKGRQFLIETHSEHLILRIRRRVAEGRVRPESIRIFFVEKPAGWTEIHQLSLKETGHFTEWPSGFFEEGYEEALALASAGVARRKSEQRSDD
jgi:predicted ATPase